MAQKISQYYTYKIGEKEYKLRYKTPKVGEQIAIGQAYASLKAGFTALDELADVLAYATATLNIVIVDKPADLKLEELDSSDWTALRQMLTDYQNFAFFRNEAPAEPSST